MCEGAFSVVVACEIDCVARESPAKVEIGPARLAKRRIGDHPIAPRVAIEDHHRRLLRDAEAMDRHFVECLTRFQQRRGE